ncbi:MAG: PAS domain-containing protein, partial [Minisyncoccota bacterium]
MDSLKELGPLFSFIAEGLILFNEKGVITMANPHANLLLDYTSGEILGKHIDEAFDMYLDHDLMEDENKIARTVFGARKSFIVPHGHTLYFQSKGERKFPVFASAKLLTLYGVPQGALVFRDITTEKALENYKKNTAETLSRLTPILQKAAAGDFSVDVAIPEKEDEFTELIVGLSLMIEDLRELEQTRKKIEEEKMTVVEEKRKLTEQYSKELEKKVEEKTSELNQAKMHIEAIIENLTSGLV